MGSFSTSILMFYLSTTIFELVSSEAEVVIRFKRFVNPGGKGDNGNCCDGRSIFCEINGCDHFFTLCLDSAQGNNGMGSCSFGSKVTDRVKNQDSITFGSRIGDTTNRFTFRMDTWPTSVKLKVHVEDRDKINGHDYVDTLVSVLTQTPHPSQVQPHTLRDRCTLLLEMEVRCLDYWWGEDCATYCRPRDSHSGHYNCSNNGTKVCLPGWTGERCDDEIYECASSPCYPEGGVCEDAINSFTCLCNTGYSGVICSQDIDECENGTLCSGHGDCVNIPGSYSCNCSYGFTGDHCEVNIDECSSSPCVAGNATCEDGVGGFTCLCPPGLTGDLCEVDINECLNHGCLNNATCVDRSGYYGCKCAPGYEGNHCETEIDECASSPCHGNASRCHDNIGSYHCECFPGWTGVHCDLDIDECESSPCLHGNCTDMTNNYTCQCDVGFQSRNCDVNIDDCVNVTCNGNHSICVDRIAGYDCQCIKGYAGVNCTEQIDLCTESSCLNNGTCIQLEKGITCKCDQKWNGTFCNESVDNCVNSRCSAEGTRDCVPNDETYGCICINGWKGEYCDVKIPDNCLCPSAGHSGSNVTIDRTCACTNYSGNTDVPSTWDIVKDLEEQSAIMFVGDVDSDTAENLKDFIQSYTTVVLPVSYDDVHINYQLDSCEGENGEKVNIFIFDIETKGKRVPYSVVDSFFEQLLQDSQNMVEMPVELYDGEDCYETAELISAPGGGFPWLIVVSIATGVLLLVVIIVILWRVYRKKVKSLTDFDDPVLVEHKLRQSRLNSDAFILNNEAVTDGFAPEGSFNQDGDTYEETLAGQAADTTDVETQPTTPKCFVNLMYEDLPELPDQQ